MPDASVDVVDHEAGEDALNLALLGSLPVYHPSIREAITYDCLKRAEPFLGYHPSGMLSRCVLKIEATNYLHVEQGNTPLILH